MLFSLLLVVIQLICFRLHFLSIIVYGLRSIEKYDNTARSLHTTSSASSFVVLAVEIKLCLCICNQTIRRKQLRS
jgi:hypothetical protein